jgi:hypothetical protein
LTACTTPSLVRGREGLGVQSIAKQARVTHFAPYDASAVQTKARNPVQPAMTRKDIDRQAKLERRKERNLRSALS